MTEILKKKKIFPQHYENYKAPTKYELTPIYCIVENENEYINTISAYTYKLFLHNGTVKNKNNTNFTTLATGCRYHTHSGKDRDKFNKTFLCKMRQFSK